MWWVGVIGLIIEIIKLLIALKREADLPELTAEFDTAKKAYKLSRDKGPLMRLRNRLRNRRANAA